MIDEKTSDELREALAIQPEHRVASFAGAPLVSLTREALIDVVSYLAAEIDRQREYAIQMNRDWAGIARAAARRR